MSEAAAIIDEILVEHERIREGFNTLTKMSGDVEAAARLGTEDVKGYFVPRALGGEGEGLRQWRTQLDAIHDMLQTHFVREEVGLTDALKLEGTPELLDALNELLEEHQDIKARLAKLYKDSHDIGEGGQRIEVWEGGGWGMKYNVESFRTTLEEHAERERVLFGDLKARLIASGGRAGR